FSTAGTSPRASSRTRPASTSSPAPSPSRTTPATRRRIDRTRRAHLPTIRLAAPQDAPALQAIYRPFVTETPISFEGTPPAEADMAERLRTTLERWPWLVAAS